jgi:curved DNA-binding protein CbpA
MSFYEILGLTKAASAAEIRQAYTRLAREKHPDRFPDPAEKKQAQDFFARVTEAFNTLSSPKSREQYDAEQAKPKLTAPAEIAADAYRRGIEKIKAQDYHEAMTLLRSAIDLVPDVAQYHLALARVLAKNPNWTREATSELEATLRLDPNSARAHVEMARILAAQGLKLRARRSAENALRLAPEQPEIQELAAQLGVGAAEPTPADPPAPGGIFDRFRKK